MNFPVGNVVEKGEAPFDAVPVARRLAEKNFSGYIILSIKGKSIEEGALFFRGGKPIGCVAECLSAGKEAKSKEALAHFLNFSKAKGFFQAVELSKSQVDLVTAFDEKMLFGEEIALKDVTKLIPKKFEERFGSGEAIRDVFETHGLASLK